MYRADEFFFSEFPKLGSVSNLSLSKRDRGFVLPLVISDDFFWRIQAIGEEA